MQYIWLIILWLLFGLLHSIFAASRFKHSIKKKMKSNYRYFRTIYSFFALVSLVTIIWYHFSINSLLVWDNSIAEKVIAVILCIPSIIIMAISIKKYFLDLSGIDVFLKRRAIQPQYLEQTGLHKYVRHPLYSGTLLLIWSIFLWQPTISNFISALCLTLYTIVGTYFEEKKLVMEFGEKYIAYAKKVPMLVPGL